MAISRDVKFVDTIEILRGDNKSDCDGTESARDIAAGGQPVENNEQMRQTKGVPPTRFIKEIDVVINGEPCNYDEAFAVQNKYLWIAAMKHEYKSLINNSTWRLVILP